MVYYNIEANGIRPNIKNLAPVSGHQRYNILLKLVQEFIQNKCYSKGKIKNQEVTSNWEMFV